MIRGVVPRGAGGAMAPPDFGRSVNPSKNWKPFISFVKQKKTMRVCIKRSTQLPKEVVLKKKSNIPIDHRDILRNL